jgi:hypothetical protein
MPNPLESRPRYYQGQYIGPEDLDAAVAYARAQESRHILGGHAWGIALGLTLVETPVPGGGVQVSVTPGYGWDGFGRPISVLAPVRLPESLFAAFTFDPALDSGGQGRLMPVWMRYNENNVQPPRPGFQVCDVNDQSARVREGFVFEVGSQPPPAHDKVFVAGRAVDATAALQVSDPSAPPLYDESVPEQGLPAEGERARWLLPVGYVRWQPSPTGGGQFVPRQTPDDLNASRRLRRNIGVVAEGVLAADGVLRLARRGDPPSPSFSPPVDETVWISGITRAEGDLRIAGALVEWRDAAGSNHGALLAARRTGDAGKADTDKGGRSLEVLIGPDGTDTNQLAIGPQKSDGSLNPRLLVTSGGNVGIGAATPGAKLEIQDGGDLVLKAAAEDAGDIIFQRFNGDEKARIFSKPTAGAGLNFSAGGLTPQLTVAADGKVGIATDAPTNRLHVNDATGIRQNRLYLSGGDGWSSLTYNANHDVANGQWVFPDPSRPAATIELDDNLGAGARCEIFTATKAATTAMLSRLKVDGETGNVGIGQQAPATRLHVVGDRIRLETANADRHIDLRVDGSAVDLHSETSSLFLRASGTTPGSNSLVMNPFPGDGMVAVGHSAPVCKLHLATAVAGDPSHAETHAALIENTSTLPPFNTGNGNGLAIRLAPGGSNNFLTFFSGATPIGSIHRNTSSSVGLRLSGADFAEALPLRDESEAVEPGDVVGIFEGTVSRATRGAQHVAVVSTHPAVLGNALPDREHPSAEIALLGQVPVKVRGAVRAGAYLVPCGDEDGVAVAVAEADLDGEQADAVVARALETDAGKGVRTVRAAVGWGTREAALAARLRKLESLVASLTARPAPAPRPSKTGKGADK